MRCEQWIPTRDNWRKECFIKDNTALLLYKRLVKSNWSTLQSENPTICDVNFTVFTLNQEVVQNREDLDFLTLKIGSITRQKTINESLYRKAMVIFKRIIKH